MSRGIVLLMRDLVTRWGGWSVPWPGQFTPGKEPGSLSRGG